MSACSRAAPDRRRVWRTRTIRRARTALWRCYRRTFPRRTGECDRSDDRRTWTRIRSGIATAEWRTPHGNPAWLTYRRDTTDWNTISACLANPYQPETGDEYHIPAGLSGWALDLGAHVGAVTIGLLLDNPDLTVLAIEAVPENVELINENLALNGLTDRATVWHAAGWSKSGEMTVEYDYKGSETAEQHRFIGSRLAVDVRRTPDLCHGPKRHPGRCAQGHRRRRLRVGQVRLRGLRASVLPGRRTPQGRHHRRRVASPRRDARGLRQATVQDARCHLGRRDRRRAVPAGDEAPAHSSAASPSTTTSTRSR